jgi:tetratricopeptide (TPR) repeat protein
MTCRGAAAVCCAAVFVFLTARVDASPESEALRAKGATYIYNLDHDLALEAFREAAAADPDDPAAYRGIASAIWLGITFRRGNILVDDYLGRASKFSGAKLPPPSPESIAGYREAIERAIAIARRRTELNPKDADAHYQLGAAVGLRASYTATVEGSVAGAFRAAKEAYEEHEKVLALAPHRKDAGLIVGTYRYVVATLSLPLRWVAYMAGFGGNRDRGVKLIEDAAAYGGDNTTEARFALILLYNREQRFDDALAQLARLRTQYPRNRLVWLESGSTALRAGRPAEAEKYLSEGLVMFSDDRRTRMFGEEALWLYKRGVARAGIGRTAEADADLRRALALTGRNWVHGRTRLELGRLALNVGNKDVAKMELTGAVALAESDSDPATAAEARRLMK